MWLRQGPAPRRPFLVAHAAGAALCGGDTLAGLQSVLALGADMIEFDVRTTRDGTLVVYHDASVDGIMLASAQHEELAAMAAGLATVEQLLDAAAGRVALDVELKEAGYEERVLAAVLARVPAELVVMTSFCDQALTEIKRLEPRVATGLLVGRRPSARAPWDVGRDAFPFQRLAACGADFLAPSHLLLRATALARRAGARGVRLLVWTVDNPRTVARLLADDCILGVVTDSAEVLGAADRWPRPPGTGHESIVA